MVGMDPSTQFPAELHQMDEADDKEGTPGRTREELDRIHPRLKKAASAAIKLLQGAGIQRVEALPYALVLPPLMHFFDKFPAPYSNGVMLKLRRFAWLVAAGGAQQQHRSTYQRAAARFIRSVKQADEAVSELVEILRGGPE